MNVGDGIRDERGLVGKLAVVWLLFLAVFVVAIFDAGSIALTRYKAQSAAQDAAQEAANVYKQTHDQRKAYEAAIQQVESEAPGGRIPAKDGFAVNTATGLVTVSVVKDASTLMAGRIGFLRPFTKLKDTETAGPVNV